MSLRQTLLILFIIILLDLMSAASTSPVVLILGAGPRVGAHVARAFHAKGYRVALVSKSRKDIEEDFSIPSSVESVFTKVRNLLGTPNVVVYSGESRGLNRACLMRSNIVGVSTLSTATDPLSLATFDLIRELNVNTT